MLKIFCFRSPDAYSDPCQTSNMELFGKVIAGFWPLTVFAKSSILVPNKTLITRLKVVTYKLPTVVYAAVSRMFTIKFSVNVLIW